MTRLHVAVTLACTTLALSACGGSDTSSVERFQGAEEICGRLVSRELAEQLAADGMTCVQEMDKAASDADEFDFDVRDVTVSGTTARAQVREGDDGPTTTFELAREGGGWRVTSLS